MFSDNLVEEKLVLGSSHAAVTIMVFLFLVFPFLGRGKGFSLISLFHSVTSDSLLSLEQFSAASGNSAVSALFQFPQNTCLALGLGQRKFILKLLDVLGKELPVTPAKAEKLIMTFCY